MEPGPNPPPARPERGEDPRFLSEQLITCIGNKRGLLELIGEGFELVRARLGKERLEILDAFSGSGVVARFAKAYASRLVANDLEPYAEVVNRCYLANASALQPERLRQLHQGLLEELGSSLGEAAAPGQGPSPSPAGSFIAELYAPAEDEAIRPGERVFYTRRNALFIDRARALIEGLDEADRPFFLGPLLSEASVHANTAGVFKGFYKDPSTGLGRFGGRGGDALGRIRGRIGLPFPLWSRYDCELKLLRGDALVAAEAAGELDLAYLDPPYNQHPYGSNYFMLNLIAQGRRPERISRVSGIPADWQRSAYNRAKRAAPALEELICRLRAKFVILSFNSEGFVGRAEMEALLRRHGRLEVLERDYAAFRGSRNLRSRPLRVREFLYILEKS